VRVRACVRACVRAHVYLFLKRYIVSHYIMREERLHVSNDSFSVISIIFFIFLRCGLRVLCWHWIIVFIVKIKLILCKLTRIRYLLLYYPRHKKLEIINIVSLTT